MQTNFLRAGHGPRHPLTPLTPTQTASRIVESIRQRIAEGRSWDIADYTQRVDTIACVEALLGKGE